MRRVPPHDYEIEQAYLGAVLHLNAVYYLCSTYLKPEHFADAVHGRIYEAIGKLLDRGSIANILTLKAQFEQDEALEEIGGAKYLARLTGAMVTTINADDYARAIVDLAERRRIIEVAEEAIEDAYRPLVDRSATDIASNLSGELTKGIGLAITSVRSIGDLAIGQVEALKEDLPCYSTGFPRLDEVLGGGLYSKKFYGLGARFKVGKTMTLATIATNLNNTGVPVLYLSLEMDPDEIAQRIMAREMGINSVAFLDRSWRRHPDFMRDAAAAALRIKRERDHLLFETKPRMPLDDVKATISRVCLTRGIKGAVVDYMQLVGGIERGQSQATHLDNVAAALAELTKRHGIFILTAAQLNQEENVRGGEGLLMGCDVALKLHKVDGIGNAELDRGWIEMVATRYVKKANVGSEDAPAYEYVTAAGPYLREIPVPTKNPAPDMEGFVA